MIRNQGISGGGGVLNNLIIFRYWAERQRACGERNAFNRGEPCKFDRRRGTLSEDEI